MAHRVHFTEPNPTNERGRNILACFTGTRRTLWIEAGTAREAWKAACSWVRATAKGENFWVQTQNRAVFGNDGATCCAALADRNWNQHRGFGQLYGDRSERSGYRGAAMHRAINARGAGD
jgi:hypothetical protein